MNQLLKDAIADAKAVRETALANAKVALEEAFAPKLQSMLSHKIKEEMEEEEGVEVSAEDEKTEVARMQKMAGIMSEEDDEMAADEEEVEADEEEITADEEEIAADEADMDSEEDMDMEMDMEDEEEVSDEELEEILRELEGEEDSEDKMESEDPEAYDMKDEGKMKKKNKMMEEEEEDSEDKMDDEIDLEEIINALKEEDEAEEEEKEEKMDEIKSELNEAYSVIKFLRSKLNEVNLLNAKLLFVNKLFRKGELTETQKVKIIETFDRAKNVREAKLIYATLSESVGKVKNVAPAKKKMTEGLASAPQKKTQIISEGNEQYNRFKALVEYNNK